MAKMTPFFKDGKLFFKNSNGDERSLQAGDVIVGKKEREVKKYEEREDGSKVIVSTGVSEDA